jgi:spore coat polysaccharide biosynthesis protein SpsF (cytidylyltransferase family)
MIDHLAIVCSRIESSRLPGKAFKKIAGRPAIEHIIKRLQAAKIKTVIAVPRSQLVEYQTRLAHTKVDIIPGNPDSPLHRLYDVARQYNKPKWIIRITQDDIITDTQSIFDLLEQCEKDDSGYGRCKGIIDGADAEVIRFENLEYAATNRIEPTEFVTYFVKGEGLPFPKITRIEPRADIRRDYRLTMDYPDDAKALEVVMRSTGPDASVDTICHYLDNHPYVMAINRLPEFSIYTCAYNAEEYISRTILSVLGSDIPKMEYIVVDDHSTDNTLNQIAKHFTDPNIKIILNEENKGLASSSNIALSACRGKYVMRIDADDMLLPNNFSENLWTIKNKLDNGASVVYSGFYEIDEDGQRKGDMVDPRISHHAGCAIMNKSILNELRFKDGLRHWDGLDLYSRIGSKSEYFDYPLWLYRKHKGSMSNTKQVERAKIKGLLGLDRVKIKKEK